MDKWTATKTNGIDHYSNDKQSDLDYGQWKDSTKSTKDYFKKTQTYTNNFISWRDNDSGDGQTNGFKAYQTSTTSTTDYQEWKKTLSSKKDLYLKSNQFLKDFEAWLSTNDNGIKLFLKSAQSQIDYDSWDDPQIANKEKYLKSKTYKEDLHNFIISKSEYLKNRFIVSSFAKEEYNIWKKKSANKGLKLNSDITKKLYEQSDKYLEALKNWLLDKKNGLLIFRKSLMATQAYTNYKNK